MIRPSTVACIALLTGFAALATPARAQSAAPTPTTPSAPALPTAAAEAPPSVPPPPPAAPVAPVAPAPASAVSQPRPNEPPLGRIDLSTPPPAPPVGRTYHLHDGFYARASLGFGSLSATFDDDDSSGRNLEGSGPGLGMELLLGGSPVPGVAIGGELLAEGSASIGFDRGSSRSQDRSLSLVMIGPFIDGFPTPNKGWHLGGMLGFARMAIEASNDDRIERTNGLGGAFWFGHDFWVGDDFSIGPLLRFSGALTGHKDDNISAQSFALTLMITALYH